MKWEQDVPLSFLPPDLFLHNMQEFEVEDDSKTYKFKQEDFKQLFAKYVPVKGYFEEYIKY